MRRNDELAAIADPEIAFVKSNSHRSFDKLKRLCGDLPWYWWTMHYNYQVIEIPSKFLDEALKIKGISKSKPTDHHFRSNVSWH